MFSCSVEFADEDEGTGEPGGIAAMIGVSVRS